MEARKVHRKGVASLADTRESTVGTGPEMKVFKKAFKEAMETPALAVQGPPEGCGVMANGSPIRESFLSGFQN